MSIQLNDTDTELSPETETVADTLSSALNFIASRASQGAAYRKNWGDQFACDQVSEAWTMAKDTFTVAQLRALSDSQLFRLGFRKWDETLRLIPLWAWNFIADGETLDCISGASKIKGQDKIDLDVRGGCIAYGFSTPQAPS